MPCLSPHPRAPSRLRPDGLPLGNVAGELRPEADEGADAPLFGPDERTMRARKVAGAVALLRDGYGVPAAAERYGFSEETLWKVAAEAGVPLR